jgi:Rer1 family
MMRICRPARSDCVSLVCYSLGIYLLNLFLAFLQPKFDPSVDEASDNLEDGSPGLPSKNDEEFRPFIRRLPEFKFWHSATRAIAFGFVATWFTIFDIPVFWPVLVIYWIILFCLTSKFNRRFKGNKMLLAERVALSDARIDANEFCSEETNSAHD